MCSLSLAGTGQGTAQSLGHWGASPPDTRNLLIWLHSKDKRTLTAIDSQWKSRISVPNDVQLLAWDDPWEEEEEGALGIVPSQQDQNRGAICPSVLKRGIAQQLKN